MDDELLTVREAAAMLKVTPKTVYAQVKAGRLPAQDWGPRSMRIKKSSVLAGPVEPVVQVVQPNSRSQEPVIQEPVSRAARRRAAFGR